MACLRWWSADEERVVEKEKQGWQTAHTPVHLTRVVRASFLRCGKRNRLIIMAVELRGKRVYGCHICARDWTDKSEWEYSIKYIR